MKRILFLLLIISSVARSQTTDSTKYIHYRYEYGKWMSRSRVDSVQEIPLLDTIYFKPQRPAFTVRPQDSLLYFWDLTKWSHSVGGSGGGTTLSGTGYVKMSGSTPSYISSIGNSDLTNSSITIAGNSTALGGTVTLDNITGLSSTGLIKRTAANTLGIAVAGTDYVSSEGDPVVKALTGVVIGNTGSSISAVSGTASQLLRRNAANTGYEFFTPTYLTSETDPTALKTANNLSDLGNAATARTNLGGTTVGQNFFTATNPGAITFPKVSATNTVTFESAATHLASVGAQPQLNGTGFVKSSGTTISYDNSTYLTGNQTISFAPTGDVTGSTTGTTSLTPALTIGANKVTNSQLAQMAAHTFKGNNTGSAANAIDLTATQLTAELNTFTTTLKGLVPSPGTSTGLFLKDDGTWAAPSGSGSGTVNAGAQYRLAYYPNAGSNTVVGASSAITGNKALTSDANGLPTASTTTDTELGYLSGTTSSVQTQINGKEATFTETTQEFTGSTSSSITLSNTPKSGKAEMYYLNGIVIKSSNISRTGTTVTLSGFTRESSDVITAKYSY